MENEYRMKYIGLKIKELRVQQNLSQQKLAEKCGGNLVRSTISQYESAVVGTMSINILYRIADGLGVPLKELIPDEEQFAELTEDEKKGIANLYLG